VPLVADVRDPKAIGLAFDRFGETPDLLVNNAGIVRFGEFCGQSESDLRDTVDVNLLGACFCAQEAGRRMRIKGSGHIVNVTSVNGLSPSLNIGLYSGTKAALACVTEALALELGPLGIRVNSVAPGFIDGGMSEPFFKDPAVRKRRIEGVPIKSLGSARDVANAIAFLDSPEGAYINAHQLVVDGGLIHGALANLPRDQA
jgi:NAD(P)-dependent dehydrogenase (short-subunit alcohol dehydrogenase family)